MREVCSSSGLNVDIPVTETHQISIVTERLFLSLSVLQSKRKDLRAWAHGMNTELPKPGHFCESEDKRLRIIWTGRNQWMIDMICQPKFDQAVISNLANIGYYTDQTDAWTCVNIKGKGSEQILSRLIDIDPRSLESNGMVRTRLHHLNVFVGKKKETLYFYGARSSANDLVTLIGYAISSVNTWIDERSFRSGT